MAIQPPAGYKEIKYRYINIGEDIKLNYAYRWLYVLGLVIMFAVPSQTSTYLVCSLLQNSYMLTAYFALVVSGRYVSIIIHEAFHFACAKLLKYRATMHLDFRNNRFNVSLGQGQYIQFWHNIAISAAPLVLLTAVIVSVYILVPVGLLSVFLFSMLINNIAGASMDVCNIVVLCQNPGMVIYHHPGEKMVRAYIPVT